MALETHLKKLTETAERIATALETLAHRADVAIGAVPPQAAAYAAAEEAERQATPAPATPAPATPAPATPAPATPAPAITIDSVRDALRMHAREFGRDSALAVLAEFGVKAASQLDEADYSSLIARLQKPVE